MLTYSQNFEDIILARLFSEQKAGFYIDIGACHPEKLSVTKHFYDLGWKGINIEPIPSAHQLFNKERPRDINLNVAIDSTPGTRKFFEVLEFDALSTFDIEQAKYLNETGHNLKEYIVETLTLNQIFESYVDLEVDFLKIDVEGSEELVLKSIDFTIYRPKVLVVEAMQPAREFPGWGNHSLVSNWAWEHLVTSNDYIFAHYDGISRFYVRSEDRDLLKRFELPPGCFDDIHRPEEYHLAQQLQDVSQKLQAATAQLQETQFELQNSRLEINRLTAPATKYIELTGKGLIYFLLKYTKSRIKKFCQYVLSRLTGHHKMHTLPKITVVTPVFNGVKHIAETLESVLSQDYPSVEYIVVDGGSTDGTLDIIRGFADRVNLNHRISLIISEPDQGMYDAIAKGFENASGEIYCYLNADDLFECGGLLSVGEYFARNQDAHVIYHEDIVLVGSWKYPNIKQNDGISTIDLICGHILFQDGIFWRRSAYEAVGGICRHMKLAGDFDLWLRLSAYYKFIRRPRHVSCFRIRKGQLSTNIDQYYREMQQSIDQFMAKMSRKRRIIFATKKVLRSISKIKSMKRYDRLLFPFNSNILPPEDITTSTTISRPVKSPIDGKPAERLLFSTPDTRFGEKDINYIYFDARHKIAISHPPIAAEKLDALYSKYYSFPPSEMVLPRGKSPYRQFNGMKIWEKALLRLPVEHFARLIPNAWADNTLLELGKILTTSKVNAKNRLRFLDTGCFEGHLLNLIREKTSWQAFGIEPNLKAVEIARSKGHQVWQGHAENAVKIIPDNQQFDVIFMGQSIEHVDDPVLVLRRLRLLLAPGGVLVLSTPNLDSRQIDWFGPTWAHWHAPYHRFIFSRTGLEALAHQVGLLPVKFMTFSHPYWSTMSLAHNSMGLAGSASHAVNFDRRYSLRAQRIYFWLYLFWNRLGKGDYSFISMKDGSND
jgi:FkbM family methyltransferase